MTVPGIGPIISSAMVAAIGSGAAFARGRDFSAWIGLGQPGPEKCIGIISGNYQVTIPLIRNGRTRPNTRNG